MILDLFLKKKKIYLRTLCANFCWNGFNNYGNWEKVKKNTLSKENMCKILLKWISYYGNWEKVTPQKYDDSDSYVKNN